MSSRSFSLCSSFSVALGVLALSACGSDASPSPAGQAGGAPFVGAGAAGTGGSVSPIPGSGGVATSNGGTTSVGTGNGPGAGGSTNSGLGGAQQAGGTSSGSGGQAGAGGSSQSGGATGSGGTGAGGIASSGGAAGGGSSGKNPCVTKQSQIVVIGDSYITGFAGTPALQPALAQMEPSAAMWRNYAIAGISMAQGGIPLGAPAGVTYVPDEFTEAVGIDKDIKVVVMDGGGNDALLPPGGSPAANCKNEANAGTDPACQMLVQTTLTAAEKLVQTMADAGVKNMVYFFYPHLPGTGTLSGTNPNAIDDYGAPLVQKDCEAALSKTGGKLSCVFIDTRPAFGSDYAANISSDGVHPTAAGQTILAGLILKAMKDNCIGQSSGCCAP